VRENRIAINHESKARFFPVKFENQLNQKTREKETFEDCAKMIALLLISNEMEVQVCGMK
jgi:hypothetical protein